MASDSLSLERKDIAYRSLTQIIVELIRQEIYEGTHKPGIRLNIADLAQRFQASAVPVREALRNLEAEGLVEFRPNRGVVVRDLSASEVRELFLMRLPLELLAATQAALLADDSALGGIEAIARVHPEEATPAGSRFPFEVNMEMAKIFDGHTGKRL